MILAKRKIEPLSKFFTEFEKEYGISIIDEFLKSKKIEVRKALFLCSIKS